LTVTQHAQDRIKTRCGLPKRAVEKNATLALQEGVCHGETTGRLKKYIDWLFLSHNHGGNIRLYNNHVYIFTVSEKLITVLPLPNIYKKAVHKAMKRKADANKNNEGDDNHES